VAEVEQVEVELVQLVVQELDNYQYLLQWLLVLVAVAEELQIMDHKVVEVQDLL
jgi:hypothetical protein